MEQRSRRARYDQDQKLSIGRALIAAPHGSQTMTAPVMQVSTRTLRSWKQKAIRNLPHTKPGPKPKALLFSDVLVIAREWKRQGYVSARAVIASLKHTRVRLIRIIVGGLNRRRKLRATKHVLENRTSLKVNQPGVLVVLDAAKIPNKTGGELIVFRDRASLSTHTRVSDQTATRASDTLAVLEKLKFDGRLPLVVGSDNGSPFTAIEVTLFLNENSIIHLKSLPHVPQQNGSAENAVGDVKRLIKNGAGLDRLSPILNNNRKRATLNWKTPTEVESANRRSVNEEERKDFYQACKAAILDAVLGTKTAYEKRKAEREAIFQTLESRSFITRTRGHRPA